LLEGYIPRGAPDATVACGDCHLCCRNALVILLPEHGDDPSKYATQDVAGRKALKTRSDGSCWYLGPDGCTIHGSHPVICRTYDCAAHFRSMDRTTRRRAVKDGLISKGILAAGRQRTKTG